MKKYLPLLIPSILLFIILIGLDSNIFVIQFCFNNDYMCSTMEMNSFKTCLIFAFIFTILNILLFLFIFTLFFKFEKKPKYLAIFIGASVLFEIPIFILSYAIKGSMIISQDLQKGHPQIFKFFNLSLSTGYNVVFIVSIIVYFIISSILVFKLFKENKKIGAN